MAVNGLEKITELIISNAEQEAAAILEKAKADAKRITADYKARAERIKAESDERANAECEKIIIRAKSASDMECRNIVLGQRAELTASAFAGAYEDLGKLTGDEYAALLENMLLRVLKSQLESERDSLRLYGEDIAPEKYEVILSKRDKDGQGARLVSAVKNSKAAWLPNEMKAKLELSGDTAEISGGLVLKCGDVEINASFETLLAEVRAQMEAEIEATLFRPDRRA